MLMLNRLTYLVVFAMLSACVETPTTSSKREPILTLSLDPPVFLTANRNAAGMASRHRLSATAELMATDESRILFSLLVGCALLPEESVIGTATVDGVNFDLEFFGETGLAPAWLHRRLNKEEGGWISSCIFAHLNVHEVPIPISMRGAHPWLDASRDERQGFPVQEGGFFGDMFSEQLEWFACRGDGLLVLPVRGGLIDRDCAKQDPSNPALTLCGMSFAGDCSLVCDPGRHRCLAQGRERSQVLTAYVNP